MSIIITLRSPIRLPIDVRNVRLDGASSNTTKLAKQPIWHGPQQMELGELFGLSTGKGDADIVWQGELDSVHYLGAGMRQGKILVQGNPGRHLGSEMSGGEITVEGSVGDYAGAQMRGGVIRVKGSAGNFVGGHYAGEKSGMNGGSILIHGSAGTGIGAAMRRGLIAVGGSVGRGLGWNMLAGSLVVFGSCQESVGSNMKRGTIILAGEQNSFTRNCCPVNFKYSGSYVPDIIRLISGRLTQLNFPIPIEALNARVFSQFAGDQLEGGRGEVFCGS